MAFGKSNAAAAPAASKEIATVAAAGLPAAFDYGADAGVGFEGMTSKDMSIPFLGVLQSNSPQVDGDSPVEGARPGMLVNTVSNELYDGSKGLPFIPVHWDAAYVEWKPRTAGGGYVASHDPSSELVKEELKKQEEKGVRSGKIILANGHELIETKYLYCLLLEADIETTAGFAVLSVTSTKLKPFRDFLTATRTIKGNPPLMANRAVVKTIKQSNDKGTYYNVKFEAAVGAALKFALIPPTSPLLEEAKEFRKLVLSGMAKAAFETQNAAGDTGTGNTEDAPF